MSRGLGDVYKRQIYGLMDVACGKIVPAICVDVESFEPMCPLAGPVQLPQLLQYVFFFF